MKTLLKSAALACLVALTACGGGNSDDGVKIVDQTTTIAEGDAFRYYPLALGQYTVEVTTPNNGITVSWGGSTECATESAVTKSYAKSCKIDSAVGEVLIHNRSAGGTGSETAHIKIYRL